MARKFVVATWNVNSIRARIGPVIAWLKKRRPDVLCMQETKVIDEFFPVEPFTEIGYNVVFRGQKAYNGVAMVSLEKPKKVSYGLDVGKEPDKSRLIRASIAGVNIVNTYIPQGRDIETEHYKYKLRWFARLKRFFTKHYTTRKRLIWLGDLNIAPAPIDVYKPEEKTDHVCYHEGVQVAFRKAFDWGFVDVFRKHRPEPELYSFYDYRIGRSGIRRKMGWRVDHILATKTLAKKSVNAGIDMKPRLGPRPSDHTVMFAEFRI
ncbi:MAG: exodeoxyribonuclease III [Planctomycetota bacterium]|nr:MAG: exodeoxyribonuclease III [Planctomycetota bacterium]